MNDIRENIEAIRKEKRIKQEVLAQKLGVKQSTYSGYLNRNNSITFDKILQIADILGVSVVDIITYPVHYVPESEVVFCDKCKEKDEIISHLNSYISVLEGKVEFVKKK